LSLQPNEKNAAFLFCKMLVSIILLCIVNLQVQRYVKNRYSYSKCNFGLIKSVSSYETNAMIIIRNLKKRVNFATRL
jgi:hypothetical protein